MFASFLGRLASLPPRVAGWANRAGPVALLGCDSGIPTSADAMLDALRLAKPDADYYAELTFHQHGPIEVPPDTGVILPVLDCSTMPSVDTSSEWHVGMRQAVATLADKGFTPVVVGGNGAATLPILEALKEVHRDEEMIVLHFSADPMLEDGAPVRVIQEKSIVKGVISVGNRMVSADNRHVRKAHEMFYLDMHAIFSKGIFCVRDLRNDYPVYLSIDVGCLDPAYAPGAMRCESGGLSVRELVHLIHGIRAPKVLGVDIHGYNPDLDVYRRDGRGLTTFAAAKIIKESILKSFSASTVSQEEGLARVQMMQKQGTLPDSKYPEH